jgi:hypothetical protein
MQRRRLRERMQGNQKRMEKIFPGEMYDLEHLCGGKGVFIY